MIKAGESRKYVWDILHVAIHHVPCLNICYFWNWSVHRLVEDFSHTKGSWLLNHQHYHCFCGIQWIWFELLNNFLGPFFRLCFHVIQFVNVAKFVESNDKFANNYYWNNTGITRKWKDFFPNGRCPWYFWCLCVVIFNHNGPSGDTAHHFSLLNMFHSCRIGLRSFDTVIEVFCLGW